MRVSFPLPISKNAKKNCELFLREREVQSEKRRGEKQVFERDVLFLPCIAHAIGKKREQAREERERERASKYDDLGEEEGREEMCLES